MLEIFIYNLIYYVLPVTLAGIFFGLVSLPVSNLFFKRYPDEGYNIGKIIGFFSISLIYFTLVTISSFLPIHFFKLNSYFSILVSICIWIFTQVYVYPKFNFILEIKKNYKSILIYEGLFLLIVSIYFNLHTFNQKLVGESQMNIAILNTLQNSEKLPIKDFWMSGENFNYYYFGHIFLNLILKLTFKNTNDFYYALASFMPAVFALPFYILLKQVLIDLKFVINKKKIEIYAILGVVILLLTNTLSAFSLLFNSLLNLNFDLVELLEITTRNSLPNAISENFSFTFIYIPIHAHVFGLLIGIILIYLFYEFFKYKQTFNIKNKFIVAASFVMGMSYMTNTWDFIFYFCLFTFLLVREKFLEIWLNWKFYFLHLSFMVYTVILTALSWSYFYTAPSLTISFVEHRSPLISWVGLWGFYLICLGFGWVITKVYKIKISSESFFYNLFIYCFLVIIFMELIFIRDATQQRFNTYYKFSNQIFLIFTLLGGIGIAKILEFAKKKYLKVAVILLICATLTGTFFIIKKYSTDGSYQKAKSVEITVKNFSQDTYEGLQFMKTLNLKNKIIIEGITGPYTNSSFFSSFFGMQSFMGWTNHEYTWRTSFKYAPLILERENIVNAIYTEEDFKTTVSLLKQNKIDYIIIGKSEMDIYIHYLKMEKLTQTGKILFQKPEFLIIEVNR